MICIYDNGVKVNYTYAFNLSAIFCHASCLALAAVAVLDFAMIMVLYTS